MRKAANILSFPTIKPWRQEGSWVDMEAIVACEATVVMPMEAMVPFESSMHYSCLCSFFDKGSFIT